MNLEIDKNLFLFVLSLLFFTGTLNGQQLIKDGENLYLSNRLVIRIKNESSFKQIERSLENASVISAKEIFPEKGVLRKNGKESLSSIYLINYSSSTNPITLASEVLKNPNVLWAEPKYVRRVCIIPNDSLFKSGLQENLLQIGAQDAWNQTTGDKKIVIGIIDNGVDWKHPDLEGNIYKENGLLIPGSDLGGTNGTPDDDPSENVSTSNFYHGTQVAGVAGAVTNNSIGIASLGYNSSILPVKVSSDDLIYLGGIPLISHGEEGIIWAADHGAKIINLSWGGPSYSLYEKVAIDYAIQKGVLIVAGQGNSGSAENFYPANYDGVLSVGWLNTGIGVKTVHPLANYGKKVTVFAPGTNIFSTGQRLTPSSPAVYKKASGSSLSTPHVSGLAALVWSKFPNYTATQIKERIRVTSDFIDSANGKPYTNLLGHGMINAARAVDEKFKAVSVRADSIYFSEAGNGNNKFEPGEEVLLKVYFMNHLEPVENVTVTLTTTDNYVTIENASFNTGYRETFGMFSNGANQFRFKIANNVPINYVYHFVLTYSDGKNYRDHQVLNQITVNRKKETDDLYTHQAGPLKLSITSYGNLGFADYPYNLRGNGFKYMEENLLTEGAFMYGTDSDHVMNVAREKENQSSDFTTVKVISFPRYDSGNFTSSSFNDIYAGVNKLGITTKFDVHSGSRFIILNCTLYNYSGHFISNLYTGFFMDFTIPFSEPDQDTTYYDVGKNIAFVFNKKKPKTPFIGMGYIYDGSFNGYFAINNKTTNEEVNLVDQDGFSDKEKWFALSSGLKNRTGKSGDVSYVISSGPFNIPENGSIVVAFILTADSTKENVAASIKQGKNYYSEKIYLDLYKLFIRQIKDSRNYPNPFGSKTTILYTLAQTTWVTLEVFDILGRKVATLVNEVQLANNYQIQFDASRFSLASGVYFYRLSAGNESVVRKMVLVK